MIEITYYSRFNAVIIKGHSGFAEEGKDIICAGVSALAWTFEEAARRLVREEKALEPTIVMENGRAEISVDARPDYEYEIKQILSYICGGFKHIAEQSPEYVRYIERN